ncbi:hypothetical protein OIU79_020876 [Salix purpurea]|uniref:Uncharacterized protein n=1 Tax=Salix purpurea TaxID=77065 RepID=A0A9Q1AGD7_SALPP|nr:hypothetical protein OIU79_020876 [Salix purpurea]
MERDVGRSGNSSRGSKKRKMWLLKLKDSWRWRLKFLGIGFYQISESVVVTKTSISFYKFCGLFICAILVFIIFG